MIFTEEEVKIVHSWPGLEAVRKEQAKSSWEKFTPCFRLLRPRNAPADRGPVDELGPEGVASKRVDPALEKLSAFTNFRYSIPPGVVSATEGFGSRQMALLRVCVKREQAADLLKQNPALGFSLAHHLRFRPSESEPVELAARVSKMKQREIARWLGFPESQAWVNILAKIPAAVVSLESVLALRQGAKRPEVEKPLCHLQSINAGAVALVLNERVSHLVTPNLLQEVASTPEEKEIAHTARRIENILDLREQMGTEEDAGAFRSREQVRRVELETVEDHLRYLKRISGYKEFGEPPLMNTAHLEEEGRMQHNCVGGHGPLIEGGDCYVYRVTSPERATLSIEKCPDGCWRIQELLLARNEPVRVETWNIVEKWIERFSESI
jgi:hypothetical protein